VVLWLLKTQSDSFLSLNPASKFPLSLNNCAIIDLCPPATTPNSTLVCLSKASIYPSALSNYRYSAFIDLQLPCSGIQYTLARLAVAPGQSPQPPCSTLVHAYALGSKSCKLLELHTYTTTLHYSPDVHARYMSTLDPLLDLAA